MGDHRYALDPLKLENQLCFRFYTVSRLITKAYQPHLEALGLTYIQYIVMLALWEEDSVPVGKLVRLLGLDTNTMTPLLQRMELAGLVSRQRSEADARSVLISLTDKGRALRAEAECIPARIQQQLSGEALSLDEYYALRDQLDKLIQRLN